MANRKKKRQRRPSGPATTAPKTSVDDASEAKQAPSRGGANMARRERKEQARAAREAERKRAARHAAFRRAAVFSVVGLAAVGVLFWLQRAASPTDLSADAKAAASAANCSEVITPLGNATGAHVPQGTPITYDQRPPTSGDHYAEVVAAQDPAILTEPLDEPASVHFLEHAGIIAYYRDSGDAALPDDVVSAVGEVATTQPNMLMAPFPDLPDGTSLALTAWNKELTCPGSVTAAQARTIANGFADAFVCTSNAPEPKSSGAC